MYPFSWLKVNTKDNTNKITTKFNIVEPDKKIRQTINKLTDT